MYIWNWIFMIFLYVKFCAEHIFFNFEGVNFVFQSSLKKKHFILT